MSEVKNKIVVVGGYGAVGSLICRELGRLYPGLVYAAGRSAEKAERFSRSTGGSVLPMRLDIGAPVRSDLLVGVKLVVMCLDQADAEFVRVCLNGGIHYVDVSANVSLFPQVEKYREEAAAGGATAILNAGLAPGVTNLLALEAHRRLDRTREIEISILLGLGDSHGRAAVEWTVDNLGVRFAVSKEGRIVEADSFTEGRTVDFRAGLGRRKAYRYPFSDQASLPRTLGVPSVSTRLCFDSRPATALLAAIRRSGLHRLLKRGPVRSAAIAAFAKLRLGSDLFAIKVEAIGEKDGREAKSECRLYGKQQSEMTARCALDVAEAVYRSNMPGGVYSIEERLEWSSMKRLGSYET